MNFWLDNLPLWVAILPLGIYCCLLGGLQLRRRPLVITGAWDSVLLGGGLSGLAAIGPVGRPLRRQQEKRITHIRR